MTVAGAQQQLAQEQLETVSHSPDPAEPAANKPGKRDKPDKAKPESDAAAASPPADAAAALVVALVVPGAPGTVVGDGPGAGGNDVAAPLGIRTGDRSAPALPSSAKADVAGHPAGDTADRADASATLDPDSLAASDATAGVQLAGRAPPSPAEAAFHQAIAKSLGSGDAASSEGPIPIASPSGAQAAPQAQPPLAPTVVTALIRPDPAAPSPARAAEAGKGHTVEGVTLANVPVEIGLKGLAGINRFDIRLAPEDLGRVDVRLDIAEDGRVKAHLTVDRPETLAFLHRDATHLVRALEQAGFTTQDGGVALSLRDPGNGPDRWAGANSGGGGQPGGNDGSRALPHEGTEDPTPSGPVYRTQWSRSAGIDLRV